MATNATRTVGQLLSEARLLLNDVVPISGAPRFTDANLIAALNEALVESRAKRPDAWLSYGLRQKIPQYVMPDDADTVIPMEDQFYSPFLFYVVGRSELVEDTFAENGRAVSLMNKFVSQLLRTAS